MKRVVILLLWCTSGIAWAQNQPRIDSLNGELQKYEVRKKALGANAPAIMDTVKALLLNKLNVEYREFDAEKAFDYAKQCLELSERIGFKKGIAHAYNDFGIYY